MIPVDWDVEPLGALIGSLDAGVSVRSVSDGLSSFGHDQMVLKTSCISKGRFIPAEAKVILPADLWRAKNPAKSGSILISRMNTPDLVGEVGFVPDNWPNLFLPDRLWMMLPATGRKTDMRWLTAQLAHGSPAQALRDAATGTSGSMKNISKPALRGVLIPSPKPTEQSAIAEALSDVDEAITAAEAVIAKKRALKTATMQALLSGSRRLPGFSGEWDTEVFGQIATIRNDKVQTRGLNEARFCVELEHIQSSSGELSGWADAKNRTTTKYRFLLSDVLFGRLRPYLRKFWFSDRPGVCSTEIWPLIPKSVEVTAAYIYQIVQTDQFLETASTAYGTHMPRADWKFLSQSEIYLPKDTLEQAAIAQVLTDIDLDIRNSHAKLAKIRRLKTGMMQQLLTGKTRLV
ncbi:MAG TPA: restriction endonuclease subunit S [Sphingomicrobium sp.]